MLNMNSHELKHALSALISVIVSTAEGVNYMTHTENKANLKVVDRMIDILKEQENGSVTQRFAIAVLQKMSAQNSGQIEDFMTDSIIEKMVTKGMI